MQESTVVIRRATETDLHTMAEIGVDQFKGYGGDIGVAKWWMGEWLNAPSMYHVFVAESQGEMLGYIDWRFDGGFGRQHTVIELDQIALRKGEEGHGVGTRLMLESHDAMVAWIKEHLPQTTIIRRFVSFYARNTGAFGAYIKFFPKVVGMITRYSETELVLGGETAILDRNSPIGD